MERMEEPTKKQVEELESCYKYSSFVCPSCKSDGGQDPHIENPGEDYTQIYCTYCREYINLKSEHDEADSSRMA